MADIVDELVTYLKTNTPVTDLVGTGTAARIYHDIPKEGVALPFLVIAEGGGGESHEHLGGISGLAEAVMHVYAYGDNRTAANALAEACRLAVQTYRGLMGATYTRCLASSHRDSGIDRAKEATFKPRAWCRRIINIWYDEPTS